MFDNILKSYREKTGMSQSDLANRLDISRTYLSEIERGISENISFDLAERILKIWSEPSHSTIEVVLPRRVLIDVIIAPEILWLNTIGVITESSCQGPPPVALIRPSSVNLAQQYGYIPEYQESVGLFQINLKTNIPLTSACT